MLKIRKLSVFLVPLYLLIQSPLFSYSSDPKDFVKELVTDAIDKLADKNLNAEEKENFVKKIAIENVDINALSLYTLGELRKSSEKKDIIKYQETFKNYFLKSLTSRLKDYTSAKFEIASVEKKFKLYNCELKSNSG